MAKRLLLRLFAGAALTFAPVAEAAAPSHIHSAQDLFDTCADNTSTSQAVCEAYIHATVDTAEILHAAANGGKLTPLFCPPESMGAMDLVRELRKQVAQHPERNTFPAPTLIIGGAVDAYPCTKDAGAATAAPAHKAPLHKKRAG